MEPLLFLAPAADGPPRQVRQLAMARTVPLVGAAVAIATLVTCYAVAVLVEKKPVWLLDITHYTKDPPAVFIFRSALIPACSLIGLTWLMAGSWQRDLADAGALGQESRSQRVKRSLATKLGFVGAMCLVISTAMEDGDNTQWTPHVICATSFFILTMVASVLTTLNLRDLAAAQAPVDPSTLRAREIIAGTGVLILVFDALSSSPLLKSTVPEWTPHLMEWLATFDVISFIGVFGIDWSNTLTLDTAFDTQAAWARVNRRRRNINN